MLTPRNLKLELQMSYRHSPVVLLNGARQTGKSTLIKGLFPSSKRPRLFSMDSVRTLGAAHQSPQSFIERMPERVIIDEIQRVPEIFLPIKESVDNNRKPGRFLLTGSANVLSLPKLSESLAGRMDIHTLWPLSQGELRRRRENFIDTLATGKDIPVVPPVSWDKMASIMITGGYPDAIKRADQKARDAWFRSYLTSILERDVKELSHIEGLTLLPDLFAMLASRAGALLNASDLSRSLQLPHTTLKRYLTLLEMIFFAVPLRPWYKNLGKRLVKSPKIYLNDTGLLCHLLGSDAEALDQNHSMFGLVFENFVVMELKKQIGWSQKQPRIYHFRTLAGQEVDIVLEYPDGKLVGIECKASGSVTGNHFKGLHVLKEQAGAKFHRGIVLYMGSEVVPFGEDLDAVPVSALWEISTPSDAKLYE